MATSRRRKSVRRNSRRSSRYIPPGPAREARDAARGHALAEKRDARRAARSRGYEQKMQTAAVAVAAELLRGQGARAEPEWSLERAAWAFRRMVVTEIDREIAKEHADARPYR